jgi:ParB family transcriptional regulator, chromosome partitioning protein
MTDTTTTTTHEEAESVTERALGELSHIDPNSLEVGENVREYASLDKPFLDSIAEHGVLVPITAIRRHDGAIEVRNGQRRTVAARKVGLSTVPVYVVTATAADTAAETIDRVVHQIVANDQKRDLSDAQRARGIQQMIDSGLSISKVAKKLSVGKDTVKAAQTAAKSSAALEALEGGQISLTEAAVLTELEQDGTEAVERLVTAAGTPQFDHVVAQLRSERASAHALAEATAHYTERGFTILADDDRWGWKLDRVAFRHLQRTGDDGEPEEVDDTVITDPQHWAVRLEEYVQYVDSEGNVIDEGQIDWDTEGVPDAEPEAGQRHADSVTERLVFEPDWYCLNPEGAGLQISEMYQRNAEWQARDRSGESHTVTTDLDGDASDDDRQAARLRAEAEQAEAKKRERRIVVNLNKLGAAATEVRREFVTTLLARKTLPKGAATFVADALLRDRYMLTQHDGPGTAAELLGIDAAAIHNAVSDLPDGSDNRALVIALGLVLGSLEASCGRDGWRNPAPVREPGDDRIYYGRTVTSGDYLRLLVANGYVLSAVEEVVTGTRTAAEVYDEYLADSGKE